MEAESFMDAVLERFGFLTGALEFDEVYTSVAPDNDSVRES